MKTFLMLLLCMLVTCCAGNTTVVKSIVIPQREVAEDGQMIVWVHGEVKNPGRYDLPEGYTVSKVISMAGGITDDAQSQVLLRRYEGNVTSVTINNIYVDLIAYGGEEAVICKNNDEIYVNCWNRAWYQLAFSWLTFTTGALIK